MQCCAHAAIIHSCISIRLPTKFGIFISVYIIVPTTLITLVHLSVPIGIPLFVVGTVYGPIFLITLMLYEWLFRLSGVALLVLYILLLLCYALTLIFIDRILELLPALRQLIK